MSDNPNDKFVRSSCTKSYKTWFVITIPILFAICFGWIILPGLIRCLVSTKIVISPEAIPEFYSAWLYPPFPVYLKIYLFNVTNPEEVARGLLPKLGQVGPYVFLENRTKTNVLHNDDADTVSYSEHITYHFDQELSAGAKLEDIVTIINVPFVAAAIKISHDLPWPMNDLGQAVLIRYKEPLFIERRVKDVLFQGSKVSFLEEIEKDLGISMIPNNTFRYFVGQNSTAQGPYTVSRGTRDKSTLGAILQYKNQSELDYWSMSGSCNKLMGTDATVFPPFVDKDAVLRVFNKDLCRSIYANYNKNEIYEGIEGYRFTAAPSALKDPMESEENRCFCEDEDECLKEGVLNLGPCRDGQPVALSLPYFLDAHPDYKASSGLVPDRDQHETFVVVEPITGIVLKITKRIQISLILKPVKGIKSLAKVPRMLFPLFWIDESESLDPGTTDLLKSAIFLIWIVSFMSNWVLPGIVLGVTLANVLLGRKGLTLSGNIEHGQLIACQLVPLQETQRDN